VPSLARLRRSAGTTFLARSPTQRPPTRHCVAASPRPGAHSKPRRTDLRLAPRATLSRSFQLPSGCRRRGQKLPRPTARSLSSSRPSSVAAADSQPDLVIRRGQAQDGRLLAHVARMPRSAKRSTGRPLPSIQTLVGRPSPRSSPMIRSSANMRSARANFPKPRATKPSPTPRPGHPGNTHRRQSLAASSGGGGSLAVSPRPHVRHIAASRTNERPLLAPLCVKKLLGVGSSAFGVRLLVHRPPPRDFEALPS